MNSKIIKPTPFGPVVLLWTVKAEKPVILRIFLSRPQISASEQVAALYANTINSSCREIDDVATSIYGFIEGEEIIFSLDLLDLPSCGLFQQQVLRAEYMIPRGRVTTYQLLAAHLGKRRGARVVGNALAANPFPIIIPCHRAIRSDRSLGGYQGGIDMKRCLLEMEGIPFEKRGKVVCTTDFWYF